MAPYSKEWYMWAFAAGYSILQSTQARTDKKPFWAIAAIFTTGAFLQRGGLNITKNKTTVKGILSIGIPEIVNDGWKNTNPNRVIVLSQTVRSVKEFLSDPLLKAATKSVIKHGVPYVINLCTTKSFPWGKYLLDKTDISGCRYAYIQVENDTATATVFSVGDSIKIKK